MKIRHIFICLLFLLPGLGFAEVDQSIPFFIATTAKLYGIDPKLSLFVSNQESGWNCHVPGDSGRSFGCWQIFLPAHPEITKEQAEDLVWSTNWAMKTMIADGGCRQWSVCPK